MILAGQVESDSPARVCMGDDDSKTRGMYGYTLNAKEIEKLFYRKFSQKLKNTQKILEKLHTINNSILKISFYN